MTLELPERLTSDDPSDMKNAEIFADQHGMRLRWTKAAGWRIWDTRRWALDSRDQVMNFAAATARTLAGHVPEAAFNNKDLLRRWMEHITRSQNVGGLKAMLEKAHSEPRIALEETDFDRDPWLLNCTNGTLHLQTYTLAAHRAEDHITQLVPWAYDPTARAPRWEAFLFRVLGGDTALIDFVQRAVGYTLTGLTVEHCLFFLYGTGKNGKSTFIETIQALFGNYAIKMPMQTLLLRRNDGPAWEVADLPGRRLAVAQEVEQGRKLAEALVKDLTGGDTISACRKHHDPFTFRPVATWWIYGNHKPVLTGTDEGIRRRIRLIPFTLTIPPAERDPFLGQKLLAELPGILRWAVEGCARWQTQGLEPPAAVTDATHAYFNEMDILAPFLDTFCVLDANARTPHKDLYAAYRTWAEENGLHSPLTGPAFSRALNERGLYSKPGSRNVTYWHGVGLVADPNPESVSQLASVRPFSPYSSYSRSDPKNRENNLTRTNNLTRNGHAPDPPRCPTCDMPMFKGFQTGRWICGEHPLAEAEL